MYSERSMHGLIISSSVGGKGTMHRQSIYYEVWMRHYQYLYVHLTWL